MELATNHGDGNGGAQASRSPALDPLCCSSASSVRTSSARAGRPAEMAPRAHKQQWPRAALPIAAGLVRALHQTRRNSLSGPPLAPFSQQSTQSPTSTYDIRQVSGPLIARATARARRVPPQELLLRFVWNLNFSPHSHRPRARTQLERRHRPMRWTRTRSLGRFLERHR